MICQMVGKKGGERRVHPVRLSPDTRLSLLEKEKKREKKGGRCYNSILPRPPAGDEGKKGGKRTTVLCAREGKRKR